MLALMNGSDKSDLLAVRRPSRSVVCFVMVGDLDQRSPGDWNHPYVGVAAFVKRLAGSVRYKRYPAAVRRPLRVRIVPVLSRGYLLLGPVFYVDDPHMAAAVVKPAGVVEFV